MSASFHGLVNGSAAHNGTAPRGRASGRAKRGEHKRLETPAKPGVELAGFIRTKLQAQGAPMWPVHPVMWLQPELGLTASAGSGLHIERKHTMPSPDFLHGVRSAIDQPASIEISAQSIEPRIERPLPSSGLAPLGWDPRAVSHRPLKGEE